MTRPQVQPVRFEAPDFEAMAREHEAREAAHPGDGDWVCGRGKCGRCVDPDCTCCNGNPEDQPWRS